MEGCKGESGEAFLRNGKNKGRVALFFSSL